MKKIQMNNYAEEFFNHISGRAADQSAEYALQALEDELKYGEPFWEDGAIVFEAEDYTFWLKCNIHDVMDGFELLTNEGPDARVIRAKDMTEDELVMQIEPGDMISYAKEHKANFKYETI